MMKKITFKKILRFGLWFFLGFLLVQVFFNWDSVVKDFKEGFKAGYGVGK